MTQPFKFLRANLTRDFGRHYAEMAIVMLVGMGVLAVPARLLTGAAFPSLDPDDPTLMLARMAVIMTVPMIPWMRWRGHAWAPCLEMAAAMLVPGAGVIVLAEAAVVENLAILMTIEHVAMFAAMFGVMVARPDEYSRRCEQGGSRGTPIVSVLRHPSQANSAIFTRPTHVDRSLEPEHQ